MSNYVVYHLHTMDSLLDSCTSYQDYIDYAASLGQTAIAFTEHGNIYNWYKKKQYAESKGMKYLHGIECYLTERLKNPDDKEDKNIRDNYHTILIAKDYDGFVELNNLFYLSTQLDHTYYKPRLSFDDFFNISDHIIKISACVQSPLNRFKKNVKERGITEHDKVVMTKLLKHYDYYEIQYHNGEQIAYNQYLYKMSKKYNKPLIVGTDTHSLNKYKAECRMILQYGKTDGAWGDEENECDLTYKTYDELVTAFEEQDSLPMDVIYEAIENTNRMADSVEYIQIDTHNKYPILYGEKDEEVLWDIIKKNYKMKRKKGIISDDKQYVENIKEEMRVFKKIDMIGFMLFMSEIMTWARNNHIATGFARGSVAGSTVAFITNITDVDPIKWDTVFSRFANENRIEAGDIDTDWYEDDRQKIYDYIIDRFGKDKTAYILSMGTLADKSIIDTIGKAFRIKAQKNNETTEYTLNKIKEIKKEYDADPDKTKKKYPDIFYYYDGLSNCTVSQSQHAAGIIVSSVNLTDTCGRFCGADGQTILPIDMDECHDMGQIKYDILGLKSVGVIDKTYKMIGKRFPKAYQIDWNDQEVYDDIANDHTAIFQFESDYSGECLKKMKPKSVEELSLVNACIRPSGETYRDDLLARHIHHNPSKIIDDMLADNLGFLVYQEDTIAFLQNICGFSGSEADSIRRAIGKKKEDEINAALPRILDGYCAKSDKPRKEAEQEAKEFLDVISSSSSYQFGKNHSIAYSLISYLMGYLRHYYPTEFCTAFLNCAKNDEDIQNGTLLATSRGCKIVKSIFRHSKGVYTCDSEAHTIYKGLSSIKYMSSQIADELYTLKDNTYNTFIDLLIDLKKTSINARQLDVLIKIDFFKEFGHINALLKQTELFDKIYEKKQFKKDKLAELGIPEYIVAQHSQKQTDKMFKDVDSLAVIKDICANTTYQKTSILDKIQYEFDYLGYCTLYNKKVNEDIYYIVDVLGAYKNLLYLYNLHDGHYEKIKYKKNMYLDLPEKGRVIKVLERTERNKMMPDGVDENGEKKFITLDEKEIIVSKYSFIH